MYIPKTFQQEDVAHLQNLIVNYPLASLITPSSTGIEVNHIPFFLAKSTENSHEKYSLQGHIAKANPLWNTVKDQSEILLVFHGPNYYISPNYYPTKQENGRAVPTWNYVVAHVKGIMSYRFDSQFKLDMLNNLSSQYEQSQEKPWSIKDAPTQYIESMLPAIVGLEIAVLSITGKWKVSQNQSEVDKQGVYAGLIKEQTHDALKIAELVKAQMTDSDMV